MESRKQLRTRANLVWSEYLATAESKIPDSELTQPQRQRRHNAGSLLRSLNDCHLGRKCEWCGHPLQATQSDAAKFCSKSCRNQSSRHNRNKVQSTDAEIAIERINKILSSCGTLKSKMGRELLQHVEVAEKSFLKLLSEIEKLS